MKLETIALSTIMVALILSGLATAALPLEIKLRGPSDQSTTTSFKVEFIYGFNQLPGNVESCSLIVNNEEKVKRQSLFSYDSNKIGFDLEQGTYEWKITCTNSDGSVSESETRTVTVNAQISGTKGFETIYNNNGLRAYIVSALPGADPVVLPPMKGGEEIRLRTAKATYSIDLLKMGSTNNAYFVELRDRSTYKISRLSAGESLTLDFNSDEAADVNILLEKTNKAVDAYFLITPNPGTQTAKTVLEEPAQTPAEEEAKPETIEAETSEDDRKEDSAPVQAQPDKDSVTDSKPGETAQAAEAKREASSSNWIAWTLIIIAIAVVGSYLGFKAKKPYSKHHRHEPKDKEEHSQGEASQEFEIIKSTSPGKKK
jgi:PKD repeat protein